MREDFDKFDLEQDVQDLKADLDKLSVDVGHVIRKSTVGRVERKIACRPFSSLLLAFGAGFIFRTVWKLFCSKK